MAYGMKFKEIANLKKKVNSREGTVEINEKQKIIFMKANHNVFLFFLIHFHHFKHTLFHLKAEEKK